MRATQSNHHQNPFMRIGAVFGLCMALTSGLVPLSHAAEDEVKANAQLHRLFEDERSAYYASTPGAVPPGIAREMRTRMADPSPAFEAARTAENQAFLRRLEAIDRRALSDADQVNYDMFRYMLESRLVFAKHKARRMPFYSDSGFHTRPVFALRSDRFDGEKDYRRYMERLAAIPAYLEAHQANMEEGIATGWVSPRVVLDGLLPSFDALADVMPEASAFYGPFKRDLVNVDADRADALRTEALDLIRDQVTPAFQRVREFMRGPYYKAARDSLGASQMPGGSAYYEDMVKYYTTLDISADEVHALGLKEVARIRGEMETIIEEVGFEGSFGDFLEFLRTDEQFYAKSHRELLMHASYIAKKIDGRLPSLFGKLPRQPYGVEAVPDSIAPNYTTGRYIGAPLHGARGGYYWVNTYALDKRPLYVLPALTLHEGMPGHHQQIALSKEMEGVPLFRLGLYPHAFGEGWGLYSEKLGTELGIYETPYERFGQLTYEMWRACRLVIDTGIHAKGWSRERAIKLMEENSALSTHNIRTEVDRYISWPGQALAYKMGELTILRLRAAAEEALLDDFDIRAFHDFLLSLGGVPMSILEDQVMQWIERQAQAG